MKVFGKVVLALAACFFGLAIVGSFLPDARDQQSHVEIPDEQRDFCDILDRYREDFERAEQDSNQLRMDQTIDKLVRERATLLLQKFGPESAGVEKWIGVVEDVYTTGGIEVALGCANATLHAFFGEDDPRLSFASRIDLGTLVQFSGRFEVFDKGSGWLYEERGLHEASLTSRGTMSEPEFKFAFARIVADGGVMSASAPDTTPVGAAKPGE